MSRLKTEMKPIMIIQKLSEAKTSRSQEKIIKDAWESDSEDFFIGLELSVNPNINFNVTSAPEIQDPDDGDPGTLTFRDFHVVANRLSEGELSGEAAKQAINEAALKANITEWNLWYRRILLKTLHKCLPMDVIQSTLIRLTSS